MDKVYICRAGINESDAENCVHYMAEGTCCGSGKKFIKQCDCKPYTPLDPIKAIAKDVRDNSTLLIANDREKGVAIGYDTWKKLIEYAKED